MENSVQGFPVTSLSVRSFHFRQWQRMSRVRVELRDFVCLITSRPCVLYGDPQLPYSLRYNRKMSLTCNLLSQFSIMHTSCCYKLFKQLLKNSIFVAFAENLLWPCTWYVAIVRVISQVTGASGVAVSTDSGADLTVCHLTIVLTFGYHRVAEWSCGKEGGDEKCLMGIAFMKCWWACERDV